MQNKRYDYSLMQLFVLQRFQGSKVMLVCMYMCAEINGCGISCVYEVVCNINKYKMHNYQLFSIYPYKVKYIPRLENKNCKMKDFVILSYSSLYQERHKYLQNGQQTNCDSIPHYLYQKANKELHWQWIGQMTSPRKHTFFVSFFP